MPTAYYMTFTPGHHGSLDRIGGLPTHLPPEFPCSKLTGKPLGFVAQFLCHPDRLPIDAYLVQIYLPVDSDDIEFLRVLVLTAAAPLNTAGAGTLLPNAIPHDVGWRVAEDPPEPLTNEQAFTETWPYRSKAGGTMGLRSLLEEGKTLLLQLNEDPGNFNFASYSCVLVKTATGDIEAQFA